MRTALALAACAVLLSACSQEASSAAPAPVYSYDTQIAPHPGIAESRPVIEVPQRGTWYPCPEIDADKPTPLITDQCLSLVAHAGKATIDQYSLVEASMDCGDGRRATDLGALGFGFVGQPIIPQTGRSPERGAVLVCLGIVPPPRPTA